MSEDKKKIHRVCVSLAAIRRADDLMQIIPAPPPPGSRWKYEGDGFGVLGLFGRQARVLNTRLLDSYDALMVDTRGLCQVTVDLDFGAETAVRIFEKKKGRRWLDFRTMNEQLGGFMSEVLGVHVSSWSLKRKELDTELIARTLNPANLGLHMEEIESVLGPLDLFILPIDSLDKTQEYPHSLTFPPGSRSPMVYAWLRRIDAAIKDGTKADGFPGASFDFGGISWAK